MPEIPAPTINTSTCSMLVEFIVLPVRVQRPTDSAAEGGGLSLNPLCGSTGPAVLTAQDNFLTPQDSREPSALTASLVDADGNPRGRSSRMRNNNLTIMRSIAP